MDYWHVIEPHWDAAGFGDEDKFLRDFPALPEGVRHLLATHWLVSEVCNGGFHQFFSNWTGLLAPEAAEGFGVIGLASLQAITNEAMAFFGEPYPRNDADRNSALEDAKRGIEGAEREDWDPFYGLDDRFYSSMALPSGVNSFEVAADAYAAGISTQSSGSDLPE